MKDPLDKLDERLNRLQKAILDSFEGKKYTRQEILDNYKPKLYKQKKTYPQPNWHIYDQARRKEKLMFLTILKASTDFLNLQFNYKGNGRPKVDLKDIIKNLCIKTFNNYSSWNAESELILAKSMGIIDRNYKRSTLVKYLASPEITQHLHKIYKIVAEPLASLETTIGTDASGFSQFNKARWITAKKEKNLHNDYAKIHISSGTKTNTIFSIKITRGSGKGSHESTQFKDLIDETAKIVPIKYVVADSGYLSRDACDLVSSHGAMPFIMPKKNTVSTSKGAETSAWNKMVWLWKKYRPLFAYYYHQRSNLESTFSMLKTDLGIL